MAIQFVAIKCPECGANLSVEEDREMVFCQYCGCRVQINNDNVHIYKNIDEARIRETETQRIIRLKELELEEKEKARSRKGFIAAYGIAAGLVIIGGLMSLFHFDSGTSVCFLGLDVAMFVFAFQMYKHRHDKKKYISPYDAQITMPMLDYRGKNFNGIVALYRGAGFEKVTAIPLNDLNMLNMRKNGQVQSVTINGQEILSTEQVYPKNSEVLIMYHSR